MYYSHIITGWHMDSFLTSVAEILLFVDDLKKTEERHTEFVGHGPDFFSPRYFSYNLSNVALGVHLVDEKNSTGVAGKVA